MQFVVGIICIIAFLFALFILGKDDYVLIRKNISLEQLFDFSFFCFFIVLLFLGVLHIFSGQDNFLKVVSTFFYSPKNGLSLSLTPFVFGSVFAIYLIGKYRKFPVSRLFDFLSLSFLTCLPFWYFLNAIFVEKKEIKYFLAVGLIMTIAAFLFWKFILPRINSNKLKDGSLGGLFLTIFSLSFLITSVLYRFNNSNLKLVGEDIVLLIIFFGSILYFFVNEKFLRKNKSKR